MEMFLRLSDSDRMGSGSDKMGPGKLGALLAGGS